MRNVARRACYPSAMSPTSPPEIETYPPLFYYAPLPDVVGERVTLTGDEASHALGARRLQVGGDIGLFDGQGTAARAVVTAVDRRRHTLEAKLTDRQRMPNPRPAVHLACALPKGDRAAVLLDMATQLGMVRFTPLVCTRSVVKPGANSRERLRRICLEACKQSRRFYLPEIEAPASPRELARRVPPGNLWIAHPTVDAAATFIRAADQHAHAVHRSGRRLYIAGTGRGHGRGRAAVQPRAGDSAYRDRRGRGAGRDHARRALRNRN